MSYHYDEDGYSEYLRDLGVSEQEIRYVSAQANADTATKQMTAAEAIEAAEAQKARGNAAYNNDFRREGDTLDTPFKQVPVQSVSMASAAAACASTSEGKTKRHTRVLMGCWQLSAGHRVYGVSKPPAERSPPVGTSEDHQPPHKVRKCEPNMRPSLSSVLSRVQWHVDAGITTFDMVCFHADTLGCHYE